MSSTAGKARPGWCSATRPRCPILVIVGEQDPGTPPEMAREIHDNAPGSKLVVLPQAAHLANLEQPEGFSQALAKFLSSS
jgi:pimeloyl-ACP methyl ester carboxylesterase